MKTDKKDNHCIKHGRKESMFCLDNPCKEKGFFCLICSEEKHSNCNKNLKIHSDDIDIVTIYDTLYTRDPYKNQLLDCIEKNKQIFIKNIVNCLSCVLNLFDKIDPNDLLNPVSLDLIKNCYNIYFNESTKSVELKSKLNECDEEKIEKIFEAISRMFESNSRDLIEMIGGIGSLINQMIEMDFEKEVIIKEKAYMENEVNNKKLEKVSKEFEEFKDKIEREKEKLIALIKSLKTDLKNHEKEIKELKNESSNDKKKVNDIETQLEELKNEHSNVKERMKDLEKQLEELKKENINEKEKVSILQKESKEIKNELKQSKNDYNDLRNMMNNGNHIFNIVRPYLYNNALLHWSYSKNDVQAELIGDGVKFSAKANEKIKLNRFIVYGYPLDKYSLFKITIKNVYEKERKLLIALYERDTKKEIFDYKNIVSLYTVFFSGANEKLNLEGSTETVSFSDSKGFDVEKEYFVEYRPEGGVCFYNKERTLDLKGSFKDRKGPIHLYINLYFTETVFFIERLK